MWTFHITCFIMNVAEYQDTLYQGCDYTMWQDTKIRYQDTLRQ